MFPGVPVIRLCSECSGFIEEQTLLSGNTLGAEFWTDGRMIAPMLPDQHLFYKCPHCDSLLWSDELEEVQVSEIQSGIESYTVPAMHEYLYELSRTNPNKTKREDDESIKYLRIQAWWSGNDIRRQGGIEKPLSREEKDNLMELGSLLNTMWDETDDNANSNIFQAEIKRELSMFDDCSEILERIQDDTSDIVFTIKRLNEQHNSCLSELEEYTNETIEEFYDNGNLESRGLKFKDEKYGLWTTWFENGQKNSEGKFINGIETEMWTYWHPNGAKCEEGSYIPSISYYSRLGFSPAQDGIWTEWYDNGQKKSEGCYQSINLLSIITEHLTSYDSGMLELLTGGEGLLCYRIGLWNKWYENGQIKEKCSYRLLPKVSKGNYIDILDLIESPTKRLYEKIDAEYWYDNGQKCSDNPKYKYKSSEYESTSAIAKEEGIVVKKLFNMLIDDGYIYKDNKYYRLTSKGYEDLGGLYRTTEQVERNYKNPPRKAEYITEFILTDRSTGKNKRWVVWPWDGGIYEYIKQKGLIGG